MMQRTYITQGIVIKRKNYGETDKILTIFTRQHGKIKVIAKGIRKIRSRRAPHLEVFNNVKLFLATGRNIDYITEAETIDNFLILKKDLNKIGLAYLVIEEIDVLCPDKEAYPDLYIRVLDYLKAMENIGNINPYKLTLEFSNMLLQNLGFLSHEKSLDATKLNDYIEELTNRKLKSNSLLTSFEKGT